jgi:hypothetical protein
MVDNAENILVEFDYQNISVIDPNKVIDDQGKVQERLIKQENLVYYVNLECNVTPRTKLAIGAPADDNIRTISVGKINFLNPGFDTFLKNTYTDEITGKNTLQGKGVNQKKIDITRNPNKAGDFFVNQTLLSDGQPGAVDNGLLGMVQVNISYGTDFLPVIDITLEDVKGRALFEGGNQSPYAAFFQFPYPLFHLTMKGYLGKAVRLPLMMKKFSSSFDVSSNNFRVQLTFHTYKYAELSSVLWGYMEAAPLMFQRQFTQTTQNSNSQQGQNAEVTTTNTYLGYEKMKELYREYKTKGLIDENFPEITITELKIRLDRFINNIVETYKKTNVDVLNDLDNYQNDLLEYEQQVFTFLDQSWAKKYLNQTQFYIDKKGNAIYQLKEEWQSPQKKQEAIQALNTIVTRYNESLKNNKTLGQGQPLYIPIKINIDTFKSKSNIPDLNIAKTFYQLNQKELPTDVLTQADFEVKLKERFYKTDRFQFEGLSEFEYFNDTIKILNQKYVAARQKKEEEITVSLQSQLSDTNTGIGFLPTMRNILAVFFAQGEAFLRLLDDVHYNAWNIRDNKYRKAAVFGLNTSVKSIDDKQDLSQEETPIYPWPQVIIESLSNEGEEKFELAYPGDPVLAGGLKAYVPEIWPEVNFVEEFIRAFTQRATLPKPPTSLNNSSVRPNRMSFNAVEFPIGNQVFFNTEEVKFLYEIYERLELASYYSLMSRDGAKLYNLSSYIAESELLNIIQGLGSNSPLLTSKLKNYNLNSTNYLGFLRHISNTGQGEAWQNFIRGYFNTPYIKNDINTTSELFASSFLNQPKSQPNVDIKDSSQIKQYFAVDNVIEPFTIVDIYPTTNLKWDQTYLANGSGLTNAQNVFFTSKVLNYDIENKQIVNFDDTNNENKILPISNYNYINKIYDQTLVLNKLSNFYKTRTIKDQFITEGNVFYGNYNGGVNANQTTSILNTPYFVNAIQKGVYNFRYSQDSSPYKAAAYLFLNSLPLNTLREKYKLVDTQNNTTQELNYIISTLKKYGAIHKLPYAWIVKYGSIWHRYKTFVNEGIDFIGDIWKDFDYLENYDPETLDPTKKYIFSANSTNYEVVLQENITTPIGPTTFKKTLINTGFYPKLIDDFGFFYQGLRVFDVSPQLQGSCAIINDTQLEIFSINANYIVPGVTISGSSLQNGTKIVSQVSGTTGGIGRYNINPAQTPPGNTIVLNQYGPTFQFLVLNQPTVGYTSLEIQDAIDKNELNVIKDSNGVINKPNGFDSGDINRSLNLSPWSLYLTTTDKTGIFPLPSFGSQVNQTLDECFNSAGGLSVEVLNNKAMYNGSVRSFWKSPNYGYFDNSKVLLNQPDQYNKKINVESQTQENFSIRGLGNYDEISELFSAFDKNTLDLLEQEFLNFSKSVYDYETIVNETEINETFEETSYKNFQGLMRLMMKISKPNVTQQNTLVSEIQNAQIENFKIYMNGFMNYDVVLKYGNPSQFDKRLFYTFSNKFIQDPIFYKGYKEGSPNALPGSTPPITLTQSKTAYPDVWKSLETYVGFSEIPELVYKSSGSYITDFFIDLDVEFTEKNIETFAPIIKMYATQKLKNPTITRSEFYGLMNDYLNQNETFIDVILDTELPSLRKALPNTELSTSQSTFKSDLFGEVTRYELYDSFKAINDRYISGRDYKNKTLFEDVILVDRASRDVGQKIFADIFKVKDLIQDANYGLHMLDIINSILVENNFTYFTLPAYANFYNVRDVSRNANPRPEGTLEFANSLFGTHMTVDYRDTTAKLLCVFSYKSSEHLAINDNIDYRYRDDAFDMRRVTDNPLIDKLEGKNNWDKSNKVVGFNIDIGPQNQQIFTQFDVSQEVGEPTQESLEILNQMANLNRNRSQSSQSVSLFNLYRNRSYKCSVDMLGNALIQPLMYFNLRNVPMFSGPYMITSVKHRISDNGFTTTFDGVRQPFYSIPKIDSFLQGLSTKILKSVKEQIEKNEVAALKSPNNIFNQQKAIVNSVVNGIGTLTKNQECKDKLNSVYINKFVPVTPTNRQVTPTILGDNITKSVLDRYPSYNDVNKLSQQKELIAFLFSIIYINSFDGNKFTAPDFNYAGIKLQESFSQNGETNFNKKYFCTSQGQTLNVPLASFDNSGTFISFLVDLTKNLAPSLISANPTQDKVTRVQVFTKTYILNFPKNQPSDVYDQMSEQDKKTIENKFSTALNYFYGLLNIT